MNDATIYSTIGSICSGLYSIAVGAFDIRAKEKKLASFSSCGPTRIGTKKPDLIAPGVQIPIANCSAPKELSRKSDFILGSGTSFATPFVSGTVALMFQASNGQLTSSEIRKILLSSTDKSLEDSNCSGEGYLNIDASLHAVAVVSRTKGIKIKEDKDPEEAFIEYFNHREDSEDISPNRIPENVHLAEPPENILINQDSSNCNELGSLGGDEDVFPKEKSYGYAVIDKDLTSSDNLISLDSDIYDMQEQDQNPYYTDNSLSRYKIIEIVNDYILSNSGDLSAKSLVTKVLTKTGAMDGQNLWFHQYLTPPIIFDFFKYGKNRYALNFDDIFEVVARPGEQFIGKFDSGDMIVRRILGTKYGYLWFIVRPELFTYEELSRNNLTAERGNKLAKYVHIVEGGRLHHSLEDSFCRIALDEFGRMLENHIALRIKLPSDIEQSSLWSLTEAPPKLDLVKCKNDWIKFRDTFHDDVRDALADGAIDSAVTLAIHQGIRDSKKLIKLEYLAKHGEERGYCYPIPPKDSATKGELQAIQGHVKELLSLPFPPLAQRGYIKCRKREKRQDEAHPDAVSFDITGRYELRYTPESSDPTHKPARITQYILAINQAGKHIEGFLDDVLLPHSTRPKRITIPFHGDLQDDGARFLIFSHDRPDKWWGYLLLNKVDKKGPLYLQMMTNPDPDEPGKLPPANLHQVYEYPTLMNWDWLFSNPDISNGDIIYLHERWPLTMDQVDHLTKSFKEDNISPLLQIYFSTSFDDTVSGRNKLFESSRKLADYIEKVFTNKDYGVFESSSWKSDVILAGYYARMILSQNRWTFKHRSMSQLDWIQVMLDGLAQFGGRIVSVINYLGLKPKSMKGGKPIDPTISPNKYKVSLDLTGFTFYYRGTINISKESGQRWNESFKISLLGIQVKPGFKIKGNGEASTYADWQPSDIPGKVVFLTASLGGKIPGVSGKVGAWIMQIFGSEIFPYMDVQNTELDIGMHGSTKFTLDLVNLGGLRGEIFDKKLPYKDYSKFSPVVDYSAVFGTKEDIHFCLDSAILTEDGRQALRIICANYLPAFINPDSKLDIVGHADRLGTPLYNYELSKFRAENTKKAIVDILGSKLAFMKINPWGEGESKAAIIDPPQTPNPQYRRVDIYLNSKLIISLQSG